MNPLSAPQPAAPDPGPQPGLPGNQGAALPQRLKLLALLTSGLVICFARPLYDLARFAWSSDLYSHILLVPFISLYLIRIKQKGLPRGFQSARPLALGLGIPAAITVAMYQFTAWTPAAQDRLSLLTVCFLFLVWGACAWQLGSRILRAITFPLAFLVFMVPLPVFLEHLIEVFLQHASAEMTSLFLTLSGATFFRDGLLFSLPGKTFEVARECSGIHSTLVLFITALLAGEFFLLRRRTRTALVAGVVLIGILRNAGRISILAQLYLHGHPGIFDSPLHHRGGPLFFAASLVPCFLLIWYLRKLDLRAEPPIPLKPPK